MNILDPGRNIRTRHWIGLIMVMGAAFFLLLLGTAPVTHVSEAQEHPDMLITSTDISFSRLDVVAGEPFIAYALVHNVGGGAGTCIATLATHLQGSPLGNYSVGIERNVTVLPGGSSVASFPLTLSPGVYDVLVNLTEICPDDTDLTNNNASTTIEVFASPDLVHFTSPTLILEPVNVTIQSGTERIIPLNITAFGGNVQGVTVAVLDSAGVFAEPAHSPIELNEGETANVYLRISVPETGLENDTSERKLLIQAVGIDAIGNSAIVTLIIHPPVTATSWWNPTTTTATLIGIIAASLAAINSVEWGRYKFIGIFLPLYTKLKKEDIMNQYTRGKIHGYLLANPGDYFSSIGKALDISGGNLAYHLRVLEREGEIVSKMDGVYKRFYPSGVKTEHMKENELSSVERSICEAIEETPGIIQRDIAALLGVTSPTVSYHLGKLVARGLVKARRKGMAKRYFPNVERAKTAH